MEQQRTWAEYKAPFVLRENQKGDPVMEEWVWKEARNYNRLHSEAVRKFNQFAI